MSLSTSIDFSSFATTKGNTINRKRTNLSHTANSSFHELFKPEKELTSSSALNNIETERVRIGHELHDNVNPLLAVAKLYMDIIHTITPDEQTAKKRAISSIMMAIQNIRQISSELVLSQNDDIDLIQMISALVKRINDTGIFKISFHARQKRDLKKLNEEQKINLFRITQEQLNNTIKYSRSKFVKVVLVYKKGTVTLEISDDGVGFDIAARPNGIGLNNIQNRVKQLCGDLEIKSSPGNGCWLQVAIPANE